VQGARQIRDKMNTDAVYVFIAPPSLEELEQRLTRRGTEDRAIIMTRLQNAREELADMVLYDYVIVNDVLEDAVDMLRAIIIAERSRKRRSTNGTPLQFKKV
jgi:guanylate kinase